MSINPLSSSIFIPQNIHSTSSVGQWALHFEESVFPKFGHGIGVPLTNAGRIVVYSSFYLGSFLEEAKTNESLVPLRAFLIEILAAAFFHPLTEIHVHQLKSTPLIEEFPALIPDLSPNLPPENSASIEETQVAVITQREIVLPGSLPIEIWLQIFKRLPPSALIQCLRVDIGFRTLAREVIRSRFASPAQTLPWEIEGKKWGGDSTQLIGHVQNKPYIGTPECWAKVVTFLARADYPFKMEEWKTIVDGVTPPLVVSNPQVVRSEMLFEALKHMQKLGFPMHDQAWGQLCDEIVDSIWLIDEDLSVDFLRDLVCFLASQNWTYDRQKKENNHSCFDSYFREEVKRIHHHQATNSQELLFSFEQGLELLHALGKIISFKGAQHSDVLNITAYLIKVFGTDPEKLNVSTILQVFSELKKIGGYWSIGMARNENGQRGFAALMEWAIVHCDDFTKEQVFEFFSFEWLGDHPENNQKVLIAFLNRLEAIDNQSPLSLEEVVRLVEMIAPYKSLSSTLPFFLNFYEREKAKLDELKPEELTALTPQTLAEWFTLSAQLVALSPQISQEWPHFFGKGHFSRLMNWEGKLSLDQISGCLALIQEEQISHSDILIDDVSRILASDQLQKAESMLTFLLCSSKDNIIKLGELVKRQTLDPRRNFVEDEGGHSLMILCLLYRHNLWDEELDSIEKTQFVSSAEKLKTLRFYLHYQKKLTRDLMPFNAMKCSTLDKEFNLYHGFKILQFLHKMSLFQFEGDDTLAQVTHHFLGILERELQTRAFFSNYSLLVQDPLKTILEETKQMLNVSKDAFKKRGFYTLANFF